MDWESFKQEFINFFNVSGVNLLKAVICFIVGFIIIKILLLVLNNFLKKRVENSARKFLKNLIKFVLYFVLLLIVLQALTIPITGIIALFSAFGLAISLALQGSLSNLANGLVIIFTHPFKQGDYIKLQNVEGIIKEINLMHTVLETYAREIINVPNKLIMEREIINTSTPVKRLNYSFLVGFNANTKKVQDIILKTFKSHKLVLNSPEPFVAFDKMEDNGVRFLAQCWIAPGNFLEVNYALHEDIFNKLKLAGIEMPHTNLIVENK